MKKTIVSAVIITSIVMISRIFCVIVFNSIAENLIQSEADQTEEVYDLDSVNSTYWEDVIEDSNYYYWEDVQTAQFVVSIYLSTILWERVHFLPFLHGFYTLLYEVDFIVKELKMAILIVLTIVILSGIIAYILIENDKQTSKWMNEKIRNGETIIITKL